MTECTICFNNIVKNDKCTLSCNHSFCKSCLYRWIEQGIKFTCPICRQNIEYFIYKDETYKVKKKVYYVDDT